jgi:hypothetical protein
MIKNCAVVSVLVFALVLAIEKPSVVTACSSSHNNSASSGCTCTIDGPITCYPNGTNASLVISEYFPTGLCGVRVTGHWSCSEISASLISTTDGLPIPACIQEGTDDCTGDSWSVCCGGWVVYNNCYVGTTYFDLILEIQESCNTCASGADLIKTTVKCECSTCPP